MKQLNHDPQRDVGKAHAPPEDAVMDHHAFNAAPAGEGNGAGQSRRPPTLTLEARPGLSPVEGPARQNDWRTTQHQDQAAPEPYPKAQAYRARMLEKVGNHPERGINFTDEELEGFIAHAEGLGFGQADVEAILAVKVRKPGVNLTNMKAVADTQAQKREDESIRFKDGWDYMRAYREAQAMMLVGQSLGPEVYLAPDYVEEHRQAFVGKASYLLPGKYFDLFVNPDTTDKANLGFMGALYVSTASEIDRVLSVSNGDIAVVEDLLGIPPGDWQGKEGLYRVNIHLPENKGLRMSDGNEKRANEYWTVGGKTSGNTKEAVLDEVPRIEGNYTYKKVSN
jgi:hypothetical protein